MGIIKKAIWKITPKYIYDKYRDKHYYKKYTNKHNKKINIYKRKYGKLKINNPKKVSVIIPNYNYEKYLKERIDSILFQTYPIYEIIILDDCSTDNSVRLIKEIIENNKDINIKLIENKKNSGSVFSQWQKGFENASGDYVWIAEADDSCHPKFLENVIKPFDDKDVVISYSESMRMNENNVIQNTACRDWNFIISDVKWNNNYVKTGEEEIKEALSIMNTIVNVSAVVFRNNDTKRIIDILENAKNYKMSGDWFTYYSILKTGKIAYTSKSLNYFRKHSNSTSISASRELEIKELLTIQKEIRDSIELNSNQLYRQQIRYENIIGLISEDAQKKYRKMMVTKTKWVFDKSINEYNNIEKIIEIANYLVKNKYVCDLYFNDDVEVISESIDNNHLFGLYSINNKQKEYDIVIKIDSNIEKDNSIYFYSDSKLCNKKLDNVFVLQGKSVKQEALELKEIIDKMIK